MRFRAIAAGAIAVMAAALIPASALAGPTIVRPGATNYFVNAVAGTDNDVTITYGPSGDFFSHFVTDQEGVVVKPGPDFSCIQQGPTRAECPDTTSDVDGGVGEDFTILLRDGQDELFIKSPGDFEAYGGAGRDVLIGNSEPTPGVGHTGDSLYGSAGKDIINGRAGPDFISGGKGRDRLLGAEGNDNINAKDGRRDLKISCGPGGRDLLLMDKTDPAPTGCEVIERR